MHDLQKQQQRLQELQQQQQLNMEQQQYLHQQQLLLQQQQDGKADTPGTQCSAVYVYSVLISAVLVTLQMAHLAVGKRAAKAGIAGLQLVEVAMLAHQ